MPENKVQIVIEVDSKNSSAQVRAVAGSFDDLRMKADALAKEYGQLAGGSKKVADAKTRVSRESRTAARNLDHLKGSANDLTGVVNRLAAAWGAWKLAGQIKETALLSARVDTLGVVVDQVGKNAGYTSYELDKYEESVKKMGVTTRQSEQTIVSMIQAQLDLNDASRLARVAQDAAVIGNMNSSEALQTMLHGIVTLQPEILRTVGIIVNFEQEYSKFAAANDRTVDSLTGAEKQQIAMNAALEAGTRIAGSYEAAMGTAGKQISSLPRLMEELKLQLGNTFQPALIYGVQEFTGILKDLGSWVEEKEQSGAIARWGDELKESIEGVWTTAKEWWGTMQVIGEEVGPVALKLGELLIFIKIAEGIVKTTAALKNLWPYMLLVGTYEVTERLSLWADGTLEVEKETEELSKALARQKEILGQAEAANRKEQLEKEAEAAKKAREETKKLADAEAAAQKETDRIRKDDEKSLKKWLDLKETVGRTATENDLAELQKQYDAYARVAEDKIALDRWWADEKRKIETKAASETADLYQELYRITGEAQYAEAAIEAMKRVLDAQEAGWAAILESDEAAHLIRIAREEDYAQSVFDSLSSIVEAEQGTAEERAKIAEDLADRQIASQQRATMGTASSARPEITSTGPGPADFIMYGYAGKWYTSQAAAEAAAKAAADAAEYAAERMQALADMAEAARRNEEARIEAERRYQEALERQAESIARVNESQAEFIKKLNSVDLSSVAGFNTLGDLGGVMGAIYGAMDTLGLGDESKNLQLATLRQFFFTQSNFAGYETEELFEYLNSFISLTIDGYAEEIRARQAAIDALKTEADFRQRMSLSESLAPVLSYESFQNVYTAKLAGAGTAEGYQDFLGFLESDYLPFMKTYYDSDLQYRQIWANIFGTGGVLDSLGEDLAGSSEASLESIQQDALAELNSIVGLLGPSGAIHGQLSEFAQQQYNFADSFLTAMANEKTVLGGIDTNTGDTAKNTVLLENLIKFIGTADVYEVGGVLYHAGQVEQLAAKLPEGGAFQLAPGGEYYTALSQLGPKQTIHAEEVSEGVFELPELASPVLDTYVKGAQIGGSWYTADYLQDLIDASAYGKATIGGQIYTDEQLAGFIAEASWISDSTTFAAGGGGWTPAAAYIANPWQQTMISGFEGYVSDANPFTGAPTGTFVNYQNKLFVSPLAVGGGPWERSGVTYSGLPSWYPPEYVGQAVAIPKIPNDLTFTVNATPWGEAGGSTFQGGTISSTVTIRNIDNDAKSSQGQRQELKVYRRGGLAQAPSLAGEWGDEWIVPTYEPERSRFLDSAPPAFWENLSPGRQPSHAIDADALGQAIGREIAAALTRETGENGELHIHLTIDGREIAFAVADQYRKGHSDLIEQTRRRVQ